MRQLGKQKNGQLYAKSHPLIVGPLRRDQLDFGLMGDVTIHGRGPELGEMLSALVLAYGSLEMERRKRLMQVLLRNLQTWLEEGPALAGDELVAAACPRMAPGPESAPSGGVVVEGGHTVLLPVVRKPKGRKGSNNDVHSRADGRSQRQEL